MRKLIRPSRGGGVRGTRVIPVAALMISLVVGTGSAAWYCGRAPLCYLAVLEGEDSGGHYFTTLAVASPNRWGAQRVALGAAQRQGLHIVRIEELEARGPAPGAGSSRVIRAPWDRTYFAPEEQEERR